MANLGVYVTGSAFLTHLAFSTVLAALSAVTVWAMTHVGVMDTPGERSSHTRPTPKGGGVGVVLAFLVGVAVLYRYAAFSRLADPYFRAVIAASVGIAIVAWLDDLMYWPAIVKLGAQVLAAAVAVGSGLYVSNVRLPGVGLVEIGWLGIPITLIWIVATTNAVNFIDGLNGLASGVCAITCLVLAGIAAWLGAWFIYFASLLLAAGLAGFLPFNFPRARIFMGDVGSQFCGFVLAVLAVAAGRFETVDMSFVLVPMLLMGVLFDVVFTLVRRTLAGDRLTEAHRGHLYQLANRSGVGAVQVTLTHWGFAAWGGLCCVAFLAAPSPWKPALVLAVLPPQLAWAAWVVHRARRAPIGRW